MSIDYKKQAVKLWRYMRAPRRVLRGSLLEYLVVFIVFAVLTIIYTDFVAFHITTQLFAGSGDATAGFLWLNFADPGPNPFLSPSNYVNYPYGEVLGGPTFITYTALWLPLRLLSSIFGPVAGINLVMFWGYISAALASYWLLKRLTGTISVALFAGFAAAFVPYAMYKSSGHLAYIFSYVFVLIIAGFIALWSRPSKRRALLFAIAIALAFYTDGYYVLLASVVVISLILAGFLYSLLVKMGWSDIWKRTRSLLMSAGCLLVLLLPIAYVQVSQGGQVQQTLGGARSNITQELREYRANVIDFLIPAQSNPFLQADMNFQQIHDYRNEQSNTGESTNYIGYVVIILCVIGFATLVAWFFARKHSSLKKLDDSSRRKAILFACIVVCTVPLLVSFMFSPEVYVLGYRIPLPGSLLAHYNISLWRVMARFFIPLHAILVVFAAYSLWIVLSTSRFAARKGRAKRLAIPAIVAVLGVIVAIEYATIVNRPPYDFTKVAPGYLWLKQQSDIKVIAELPVVDPLDHHTSEYVTAQVVHGKRLTNFKEPNDKRLNDSLGTDTNSETIDWAYLRGAQAVVTHNRKCNGVSWGKVAFRDDTNLTTAMCIYRLDHPDSNDTAFIRFGKGFAYSPNQPDPSVTVFSEASGTLYVTDDSFVHSSKAKNARISGELSGSASNELQARWHITQNGTVISEGEIRGLKTPISVDVDVRFPVVITITPTDNHVVKLGEHTLMDAKATNL